MRFCNVVVLIAAMMHNHSVFAQGYYDDSCLNPDGQPGNCKNLKFCEPILQLYRQYGSGVNDFIEKSICGFDEHGSQVCCTDASYNVPSINRFSNINRNKNNNNKNRYGPLLAPQCGIADGKGLPVIPPIVGGVPANLARSKGGDSGFGTTFVAGGVSADLGEWPWLAVLGYNDRRNPGMPTWLCGGSLISSRHVLTAAHCVHGRNDLYLVRLGEHKLGSDDDGANPIDVGIQKFSIHPQYNPQIFTNDLAVLKLQQDIEFTRFIKPICLPVTENLRHNSFVNTYPFIAGWGSLYYTGKSSSKLMKVQVPIVNKGQCQQAFQKFKNVTIDDRVTCGGFEQGGKGACQGDSGGPIMLKQGQSYYAIAVISYGYKCATPGIPGVFTRTGAFLDFILPLLN